MRNVQHDLSGMREELEFFTHYTVEEIWRFALWIHVGGMSMIQSDREEDTRAMSRY